MTVLRPWSLLLVLLPSTALGSPPPSTPWTKGTIETEVGGTTVTLELACKKGAFERLTAKSKDGVATLKAADVKLIADWRGCSGVQTSLRCDDDGCAKILGLGIGVAFSSGYTKRDLWLSLDTATMKLTEVKAVEDGVTLGRPPKG